jgi:hypothetical protein
MFIKNPVLIPRDAITLMFIKKSTLRMVNPRNVLRLAHFVGMVTLGRTMEDIIEELSLRINFGI